MQTQMMQAPASLPAIPVDVKRPIYGVRLDVLVKDMDTWRDALWHATQDEKEEVCGGLNKFVGVHWRSKCVVS
jgi:hypothetical protein